MKVIERKLRDAFISNEPLKISNSQVRVSLQYTELYLFGNCIARKDRLNLSIEYTLANWNTVTTRARLKNVLGISIYNKGCIPYVNDFPINRSQWYPLLSA